MVWNIFKNYPQLRHKQLQSCGRQLTVISGSLVSFAKVQLCLQLHYQYQEIILERMYEYILNILQMRRKCELSQYHPELRVSRVKDLPNKGFLIIGNTLRDVLTLQSENKMKACLDQNLKISPPKAYQIKEKSKTLVVKGVPTEFTNGEFKQILDHNKIQHAKAERMKSRRDGRSLQMFQIESRNPVEAEAIISNNNTCPQIGIIFKMEEFRAPISVQQCYNCQNFGHSAKTCKAKIKCVICGEGHSHKGCLNREKSSRSVLIAKDHMLLLTKGVQLIKNRYSVNMWWTTNKVMPPFKNKIRPRLHNPRVTRSLYSRSVNKICSHCGHPNRSAIGVLLKCPKRRN